ncbi:MAG: TIGR03619 family F420-dependent LLM class oxidoreductase [Proteobacteria bacterium]|nr:TIGR03619 family F420-dependent LLM class oxidoreductase [Pseudomonadota bacterium]
MKFAYHATMCNPAFYPALAKAAEAAGYDTFTLPDSILYPQHADSKYPYNADGSREFLDGVPFLDPFCAIPWMAAGTTRLKFSTSVMKLAIRNPVLTAKALTSIQVMTGNRFIFGVGISPWREDFEACDVPWEGRGKRMDEMIAILRGLETGEYFGFQGEHFRFEPVKLCPVPTQPTRILVGGHSDAALKRAARLGDGWISAGSSLEQIREMTAKMKAWRKEFGRDHLPFEIQAMGPDAYTPEGIERLAGSGVSEVLVAFRDAYAGGADTRTLPGMIAEMNQYAENVIHKV